MSHLFLGSFPSPSETSLLICSDGPSRLVSHTTTELPRFVGHGPSKCTSSLLWLFGAFYLYLYVSLIFSALCLHSDAQYATMLSPFRVRPCTPSFHSLFLILRVGEHSAKLRWGRTVRFNTYQSCSSAIFLGYLFDLITCYNVFFNDGCWGVHSPPWTCSSAALNMIGASTIKSMPKLFLCGYKRARRALCTVMFLVCHSHICLYCNVPWLWVIYHNTAPQSREPPRRFLDIWGRIKNDN